MITETLVPHKQISLFLNCLFCVIFVLQESGRGLEFTIGIKVWIRQEDAGDESAIKVVLEEDADVSDLLQACVPLFVFGPSQRKCVATQLRILDSSFVAISNRVKVRGIYEEESTMIIQQRPNKQIYHSSPFTTRCRNLASMSPRGEYSPPQTATRGRLASSSVENGIRSKSLGYAFGSSRQRFRTASVPLPRMKTTPIPRRTRKNQITPSPNTSVRSQQLDPLSTTPPPPMVVEVNSYNRSSKVRKTPPTSQQNNKIPSANSKNNPIGSVQNSRNRTQQQLRQQPVDAAPKKIITSASRKTSLANSAVHEVNTKSKREEEQDELDCFLETEALATTDDDNLWGVGVNGNGISTSQLETSEEKTLNGTASSVTQNPPPNLEPETVKEDVTNTDSAFPLPESPPPPLPVAPLQEVTELLQQHKVINGTTPSISDLSIDSPVDKNINSDNSPTLLEQNDQTVSSGVLVSDIEDDVTEAADIKTVPNEITDSQTSINDTSVKTINSKQEDEHAPAVTELLRCDTRRASLHSSDVSSVRFFFFFFVLLPQDSVCLFPTMALVFCSNLKIGSVVFNVKAIRSN